MLENLKIGSVNLSNKKKLELGNKLVPISDAIVINHLKGLKFYEIEYIIKHIYEKQLRFLEMPDFSQRLERP